VADAEIAAVGVQSRQDAQCQVAQLDLGLQSVGERFDDPFAQGFRREGMRRASAMPPP
jgi:hypothetical protein